MAHVSILDHSGPFQWPQGYHLIFLSYSPVRVTTNLTQQSPQSSLAFGADRDQAVGSRPMFINSSRALYPSQTGDAKRYGVCVLGGGGNCSDTTPLAWLLLSYPYAGQPRSGRPERAKILGRTKGYFNLVSMRAFKLDFGCKIDRRPKFCQNFVPSILLMYPNAIKLFQKFSERKTGYCSTTLS